MGDVGLAGPLGAVLGAKLGSMGPFLASMAMGLAIGLERDWSKRNGEPQPAGSRTFALLAVAGTLAAAIDTAVVAAGLVPVAALVGLGYLRTAQKDRGTTTEFAAVVTYLLGALLWLDEVLALGLAVVMVALLLARGPVHRFTREVITKTEIEDAVRFFVVAFVILPVVPNESVGPYGALNPGRIWLLVVALTGIGWAGHIAARAFGPDRGLLATGFAAGFVSAVATTATMGARARRLPDERLGAVGGALMASVATFVQLGLVVSVVSPRLAQELAAALVAGAVALVAVTAAYARRAWLPGAAPAGAAAGEEEVDRPFSFWPALGLALLLTAVLLGVRWGADAFGDRGAVAVAAIAGIADSHSAGLAAASLFADGELVLRTAVAAVAAGLATNTVAKVVVAFVAGGTGFGARFAGLLVLPAVVTAAVLWATAL